MKKNIVLIFILSIGGLIHLSAEEGYVDIFAPSGPGSTTGVLKGALEGETHRLEVDLKKGLKDAAIVTGKRILDKTFQAPTINKACVETSTYFASLPFEYWFNVAVKKYGFNLLPNQVIDRLRRGFIQCLCDNPSEVVVASAAIILENPVTFAPLINKCTGYMIDAGIQEMQIWAAALYSWYTWGRDKLFKSEPKQESVPAAVPEQKTNVIEVIEEELVERKREIEEEEMTEEMMRELANL